MMSIAERSLCADLPRYQINAVEDEMIRIYNRLVALLAAWTVIEVRCSDELPGLSARDWADLPPHHPLTEKPCGC